MVPPGGSSPRAKVPSVNNITELGVRIGLDEVVRTLSVAEIQLVEIARALARNADVVLMDEPTSALSKPECESLMGVIRTLAASGKAVVYTSHRLDEILHIADEVTVLRDGQRIASSRSKTLMRSASLRLWLGATWNRVLPIVAGESGTWCLRSSGFADMEPPSA